MLRVLKKKMWDKLRRATGRRFYEKMKFLKKLKVCLKVIVEELFLVERVILKAVQGNHFSDTLKCLLKGAKNDLISQFGLKLSNRIFRCYGRYEQAKLSPNAKAPILLPFKSLISNLIINSIHCQLFHAPIQVTLAELRQKF